MTQKIRCCLLITFLVAVPSLKAGTKEELLRLQSDVLALQNQIREFEKTFNERTDGLKSLVVQLNDQVAKSNMILDKVSTTLQNQESGVRATDQALLQEIRALSGKMDDAATRISVLAQQLSELSVQSKPLKKEESPVPGVSPDTLYNQAFNDLVSGNLDLAIQEFNSYLDTYPGGDKAAAALFNIGEAYRNQGKQREAIAAFTQVINDHPGTDSIPSALYKRGMAELSVQESDNAIADFKNIVQKFPTAPESELAKEQLRKLGVGTTKPSKETRRKTR
jgi:tol-pal system protein YbgF